MIDLLNHTRIRDTAGTVGTSYARLALAALTIAASAACEPDRGNAHRSAIEYRRIGSRAGRGEV